MTKSKLFLLACVAALTGSAAYADQLSLGTPSLGGNGCPGGSASAALSPDGTSLSILFDSFIAEAGSATGRRVDRKSCNIAIPVHVPNGLSVSIFSIDYRGFNALPSGGRAMFNAEYFFAGRVGPRYSRTFVGPLTDEYLVNNQLAVGAMVWSPCGADTILRTNASITAISNSWSQQAMSTVDSADIQAGVIYHLRTRRCR